MKYLPLSASILALALFAAPAISATSVTAPAGGFVMAQAADDANVEKFLANKRPVSKIPTDRLEARLKRAQALLNSADITEDQRSQLSGLISAMETELASRNSGQDNAATEQTGTGAVAQPDATTQPQTTQQPQVKKAEEPAAAPAASTAEIDAFLQDTTPLAQLSPDQLRDQFRKAMALSNTKGISKDTRRLLRDKARTARAEIVARKGKANQGTTGNATTGTGNQGTTAAGTGQPQPPAATAGNAVSAEAEAKAKALLADAAAADKMAVPELKKRLQAMRDVLAGNNLSRETGRALRLKLAGDRRILRARMENQTGNAGGQTGAGQAGNANAGNGKGDTNINITIVLKDRRPSDQLKDDELRRRIDVYREAVLDKTYGEPDRANWRQVMERDRRVLRQRLLDQRMNRKQRLAQKKINIDIDVNLQPGRRPPPYVFAAEADDADLEEVLVAPPRRKLERKYTLDEVEQSPDLRDSVARIEIDTVHFGFGESFLREEEVQNLDRIAEIMEQILAVHPGEVFMIEGHTDAVGSDSSNQQLSLARAKAVREALSTYYVIPAENLKPVGFGERFMKIPTQDAEPENRRVSIARITDLVGELSD